MEERPLLHTNRTWASLPEVQFDDPFLNSNRLRLKGVKTFARTARASYQALGGSEHKFTFAFRKSQVRAVWFLLTLPPWLQTRVLAPSILTSPVLCVSLRVCLVSFHKDSNYTRLKVTLINSFYLHILLKGHIFKYSHILRYCGLVHHMNLGETQFTL